VRRRVLVSDADDLVHPLAERQQELAVEADAIRESIHSGRPLGTPEFIQRLERDSGRALVAQKGGRPRKAATDSRQSTPSF
jgi:hypothetical protein